MRRMASRRNVRYAQLPGEEDDEDYANGGGRRDFDPRFEYTPKAFDRVPWKSIALALFLLFLGCLLLLLTVFIFTGHMEGDSSQGYALLVLGILTFLPGKTWRIVYLLSSSSGLYSIAMGSMRLGLLTIRGEELKGTVSQPFPPTDFPSSWRDVTRLCA
ncbi:hypothetical protein HID58_093104 [Brassica napus]|uniref:Transmembrane protein 230 n=1 Tax=Brassica napus TaxID=3708 RepID=A0ABQ7XEX4_BRANA|nr:hypothetical protein HID58_091454 [Brassica napus]KAH0853545.1 hypothetical protein HID58_093104 [Brassica napus]